ncbi:MAG: tetratricopeptide repeat protein, partial [Acidobacteriota bacterium]|nr:tetratricopeptide repeat protein [Acidobacteriota bacterium]
EGLALDRLAHVYELIGQNQKALEYYNQALPLRKEAGDKNGEASTLNNMAVVYSNIGETQKALEYLNQTLLINRAVGDKSSEATTLNNIGTVYSDLGEKQKAIDYYNQSIPLHKAVGNRRGEAYTLTGIGTIQSALGEKQKALEHLNQALLLIREVNDKGGEGIVLNSIGLVYSDLGEKQRALDYYNQSLPIVKAVGNKRDEAMTLNNIGQVYSDLGEKQKALDYYNLSLPIRKAVGDRGGEAITLHNIGLVFNELGETQKALDYYNQALLLRKAIGDRSGAAITLNNMGVVYSGLSEYQKAIEHYNQSLPLFKAVGDLRGQGYALNSLGGVYSLLGENQKAIDSSNQSLPLFKAAGDRKGEANALNNLGAIYSTIGENQKALDYHNQALTLFKAVGDRRGEARTLNNMRYVWELQNNRSLAILYGKQSINILQSLRADIKGLDKELQQSFLGTVESAYRSLVLLLIKENRIPEAEQVLRMLKEEEYFEFVSRDGRVVASLDERINLNPTEKQAFAQYETISLEISRIHHEIQELRKEQPIAAGDARQMELNKELSDSSSKLKGFLVQLSNDFSKTEPSSRNVEQSSQAIVKEWNDPHVAIISTIVGHDNLSVILTTGKFQRGYVIPVPEESLNKLVGSFRTAIIERGDAKPAAQELYNVLVKPLEKDLKAAKVRTLVWSLDKFLRYAPVSALWDKDGGYLVQKYASVVLALASRQNLAFRPARKNEWQALGVGVSKKAEGFAPLSYVPEELQAIVRDSSAQPKNRELGLIAGRRLLDEQFTYDSFLKSLANYRFAHAATHFKFIPGTKAEGLNSFLLMGNGEKLTLAQVQNADNIFAGIELLTLSACDTGYGGKTADGREIEGFGVLAQRKGARAIMATLWNVDDESTRDLMIEFYGDYKKPNFNKAEALRQAQLALLQEPDKTTAKKTPKSLNAAPKRFAHPYYWSPFILIGNWQ